jgi:hypothetical protein
MRMMRAVEAALIILLLAPFVEAANWTSPDGKLSFQLPDDGSLIPSKNPPAPATAMWTTADGGLRLIFIVTPNPQNAPLDRSGLEEGTVHALPGGRLLSSSQASVNGVPVYTIAVTDGTTFIQQSVLAFNGVVYKLMAAAPTAISSSPALAVTFSSLKIPGPAPAIPSAARAENTSEHSVSVSIAQVGWTLLLIAAGVSIFFRSQRKKRKSPPVQ